ncbi:hypothetical protein [Flavobacterium reichenbachii]|uniref:Lipoprotein n=1 Tax=Flavobacterium reichenbachii TaxID=362418 RepID=A0A085ZSR9_9FLAO|nr:hypothetical protein [Flavobacterium reichenbachii]KFF07483.1 hypothetical protein IW19_19105 [Flavobacterium reichenbachii]OXB14126.1 hypothetical protein B0A68_12935 [Flavobacterium reichenbachii]
MNKFLILLICFSLFSCKTYTISPESFKEQFGNIEYDLSTSKSIIGSIYYNGYQIKKFIVIDKNEKKEILENKPSLEMRVTLNNRNRKVFYFDSMKLQNDTLIGHKSRFFPKMITKIPFNDISKIEIQESGKKIEYKN